MYDRSNEHDVALYAAYLALAKRYRPNLGGEPGDGADAHFRKIEEAYEILRDALRRMAHEPPRDDQRFAVSEDAASHPDKADERADPQRQHPRQAPAFEPGSPRASPTALGEGERKGKVERLIIKVFLVAAALLFASWTADILNRVPAAPWRPSGQSAGLSPAPPPGDVHQPNSTPQANDRSAPSDPARQPAGMSGRANSAPSDQNNQANPASQPEGMNRQVNSARQLNGQKPAAVSPLRRPWPAAWDPICRPVPPRYADRWYYRDF